MRKISADLIITNTGRPLQKAVLIFDETTGSIVEILDNKHGVGDIQHYRGVLIPGYINAHCHLELSHLKGVIPTGTGLIPFIKGVVSLRDFPQEEIDDKIVQADREMYENGIVAVGDISNKSDTASVKSISKMHYYTFVEMFDFLQDNNAEQTFAQYSKVFASQSQHNNNKKSYVPHAPYSVSPSLFKYVNEMNQSGDSVSIHNQELEAENQFFKNKTGDFLEFFDSFGIPVQNFKPINGHSIQYTLHHLNPSFKTLMVHNTRTTKADVKLARAWNNETYWVTCPNANLYIENALPKYKNFEDCYDYVCIGTDSLSSNWGLSIFEEMKTIKKYQSHLDDLDIIKWGTINGARALGYEHLGALKKGNTPGINLIDVDVNQDKFDLTQARRTIKIV